jgi:hypothetical protein
MRARDDQPPVDFWENTIEFPATRLLQEADSPEFIDDWVQRRKPRQVAMLRHLLGLPVDAPLRERKAHLKDHWDELVRLCRPRRLPPASRCTRRSMSPRAVLTRRPSHSRGRVTAATTPPL